MRQRNWTIWLMMVCTVGGVLSCDDKGDAGGSAPLANSDTDGDTDGDTDVNTDGETDADMTLLDTADTADTAKIDTSAASGKCADDNQRTGDTPCGLNANGALRQMCQSGEWLDLTVCIDPDVCTNGETRPGIAFCGDFGTLEQTCVNGAWRNGLTCIEADMPGTDKYELGDQAVRLSGNLSGDGAIAYIGWERQPEGVELNLYRREMGEIGADTWTRLGVFDGNTDLRYVDADLQPGVAYEYKIHRAGWQTGDADYQYEGAGYWLMGSEIPVNDNRGTILVYVDETQELALGDLLHQLDEDLTGDGWMVKRYSHSRHDDAAAAVAFRNTVKSHYNADAVNTRAVLLIGRLPFVKSGSAAPDGHNAVSHATDQYLADVDGQWIDSDNDGVFDFNNVPLNSNGPLATELEIGRVDFAGMGAWLEDETELLIQYLEKNHAYRQAITTVERRTIWDKLAYDDTPFESQAARAFVGEENSVRGDFKDDPDDPDDINAEDPSTSYQWGIDFSDWNGANYPNYRFRMAFALNFGSHKQKWDNSNNPIRAILCMPTYGLAAFWGVRPNWFIHHMGLGETIGYSQYRSVNYSADDYAVGNDYGHFWERAVWVNLMGDPTLRNFPVKPAPTCSVTVKNDGATVSWTASNDPDVYRYNVYRADTRLGRYEKQNAAFVETLRFTDDAGTFGDYYMVRAVKLDRTDMGTYYNAAQGTYCTME